jgi:hypothetical protein
MTGRDEPFLAPAEDLVEPFRVSAGFIGFVILACLPALIAVTIFFGAWMVAGDVEAAEARAEPGQPAQVEGWKSTLVGICPVH